MCWDNLDEDLQRQEIESVANAIRDSKFSIGEKVKVKLVIPEFKHWLRIGDTGVITALYYMGDYLTLDVKFDHDPDLVLCGLLEAFFETNMV